MATVEAIDLGSRQGVLRLDDDQGAVPVHFSLDACRGVVPAVGGRVLAGSLGPEPGAGGPLSDTFAMRAGIVEADAGVGNVTTIPTVGLTTAKSGTRFDRPLLYLPFDGANFPQLGHAFREEVVGGLALGPATPAPRENLPQYLMGLAELASIARTARCFRATNGEPPHGSSFVAGNVADLGEVPWPTAAGKPLRLLLQVGSSDARRLGVDHQLNVFWDPTEAEPHLVACQPGTRRTIAARLSEATALVLHDEQAVFPGIIGLQSAYAVRGEGLPLDASRFWDVMRAPSPDAPVETYRSIQADIATWFPKVNELEADVVLGGFSSLHVTRGGGPLFKRLATFATSRFDWLEALLGDDWELAALDVKLDGPSPRVCLYGA